MIFNCILLKLPILKTFQFMRVDNPQYVFIEKSKTKCGHFQKVYSDTGAKGDQRSVPMCI